MAKAWVIMGNDFPECVFADEAEAAKYVRKKIDEDTDRRIYWRALPVGSDLGKYIDALKEIAQQRLVDEIREAGEYRSADFEEGYDNCVRRARGVLGR